MKMTAEQKLKADKRKADREIQELEEKKQRLVKEHQLQVAEMDEKIKGAKPSGKK